ncbi:MAG TPA: hypothetical protein VD833_12610 [Vicinamibacterales bacterium]|nr:hypothetical protein [Vicinamibacterales bacterium]
MTRIWWRLAAATALNLSLGLGTAAAQTVVVRHVKTGMPVHLVLNTTDSGSAAADEAGNARLEADMQAAMKKDETDAYAYIDRCADAVRVYLVERGVQPPPPAGDCTQQQVGGLFWLRDISSLVIDAGGPNVTMRLKQGGVPEAWMSDRPDDPAFRRTAPTGLVLFGGGGLSTFSTVGGLACGDVGSCQSDDTGLAWSGGVAYWLNRFAAFEAAYIRPASATATADEPTYRFESELDAHLLTLGGNIGAPIGAVRLYGKVGAVYHRASFTTTQTIDPQTVTIDGVEQTSDGGTQSYDLRTGGWSYMFGGGMEAWAKPSFAIYVEAGRALLKGEHLDVGEGSIDDRTTYILAGVRFRIGG